MTLPAFQANFAAQRLNLVSQLLQSAPGSVQQAPLSSVNSPRPLGDRLSLAAPSSLFRGLVPVGVSNQLSFSGQTPRQQLMGLGQKYGVPYNGGDLNRYQSDVIKAIIRVKAREYGIPEHVALGISGNESGWKMWKNINTAEVVEGRNIRDEELKSTDWGAMQINDKAHARAFPRAKQDLEYNIDYGLSFLARQRQKVQGDMGLGFGDWDRTVASYNLGHNPSSQRDYEIAARYVGHVSNRAEQFA